MKKRKDEYLTGQSAIFSCGKYHETANGNETGRKDGLLEDEILKIELNSKLFKIYLFLSLVLF